MPTLPHLLTLLAFLLSSKSNCTPIPCYSGVDVSLKELGHHISDHDAINSTAILFLPYKEAISLDYCQITGLWVQ